MLLENMAIAKWNKIEIEIKMDKLLGEMNKKKVNFTVVTVVSEKK
jgi:hypothetical protein